MTEAVSEPESPIALLVTVAEPTRLRILNCLAAAPLFVSDLQEILELPQPTVSRHLTVLKKSEVVKDTSVAPYVLYRLHRAGAPHGRMLAAILETLTSDPTLQAERRRALERSRARSRRSTLASESASA
jgi:ArsR family transcriptional regulator